MAARTTSPLPSWTTVAPPLGLVALVLACGRDLGMVPVVLVAVVLAAAVLAAVHHAEVVAHRVGEPFGSLVLAVAVTIIEVALIVTLMASGGKDTASLARDTVFAAVMITCNGIVGLSLFVGALRFRLISFNAEGTGAALATVTTLAVMTMVVPTFTTSAPGPSSRPPSWPLQPSRPWRSTGCSSPPRPAGTVTSSTGLRPEVLLEDDHADPPTDREPSPGLGLQISLVAVVELAKVESPTIEAGVAAAGFPSRSSASSSPCSCCSPRPLRRQRRRRKRIQIGLNLALGSAMASIGLTIPAIAVASIWLEGLSSSSSVWSCWP